MFCYKCGKELVEEAVICPNCGCWANGDTLGKRKTPKARDDKREETGNGLLFIFIIAGFALVGLAYLLQMSAMVYSVAYLYVKQMKAIAVAHTLLSWLKIAGFISSILSLGLGIVSFIMGLKEKKSIKLIAILLLIFALAVLISSFIGILYFRYIQ